mmetsp:Transcript_12558/g.45812  ORF Transcript_12558/g.45812 Transcript_12558/m.45812 type:complete len:203 (+) Transcript_12558:783-1391(+)
MGLTHWARLPTGAPRARHGSASCRRRMAASHRAHCPRHPTLLWKSLRKFLDLSKSIAQVERREQSSLLATASATKTSTSLSARQGSSPQRIGFRRACPGQTMEASSWSTPCAARAAPTSTAPVTAALPFGPSKHASGFRCVSGHRPATWVYWPRSGCLASRTSSPWGLRLSSLPTVPASVDSRLFYSACTMRRGLTGSRKET